MSIGCLAHHTQSKLAVILNSPIPGPSRSALAPGRKAADWTTFLDVSYSSALLPKRGCTLESPGELFCLSVCFFNSAAWFLPPETPISLVCHAAWESGFLKPFPLVLMCSKFHVLAYWENLDGNDSSRNRRNNLQCSEPSVIRVFWLLRVSARPEAALFEKRLITQRLATDSIYGVRNGLSMPLRKPVLRPISIP